MSPVCQPLYRLRDVLLRMWPVTSAASANSFWGKSNKSCNEDWIPGKVGLGDNNIYKIESLNISRSMYLLYH